MVVGDILKFFANRHPDKVAVHYLDNTITYRALNDRSNRLADSLLSQGFQPNDKISILLRNCSEYIEIVFALAKIGVACVPVNARLVGEEIAYIVNNSDSKGLITEEGLVEKLISVRSKLNCDSDKYFLIGNTQREHMVVYEKLFDDSSAEEPDVHVDEESCLMMVYTSGTTGRPKGVAATHKAQLLSYLAHSVEYGTSEEDIHLVAAPLFHSAGLSITIQQLSVGGTICIMRKFDPEEALRLIEGKKATNTFMVPTMYNSILEIADSEKMKHDLSSMRILISSGAPLPTRVKERIINLFNRAGLNEFYGATELAYATYLNPKDQLRKTACVGKPFWGVEIKLLDENKKQLPGNTVGELFVKSPFMMAGYHKRGKEGFEGGWFSVGDLAKKDEEGYYYIVDRKKDMIISGGVNIYPAEVEDILYSNPKILEVAVIGIPDERWGESVKAIVVLKEGETSTEMEIRDYCSDRMADYKIPKSVSLVESLPKSSSGKILKRMLREEFWMGRDTKV